MAEFAVTVIGSGSAVSMHGRHPSAQVVQYEEAFFLIDCGEGTQLRFREAGIKPFKIQIIFISHLHGDHVFGLPGLLSSYSHLGRTEALKIFGPTGIRGLLNAIFEFTQLKIRFPLEIIEVETTGLQSVYESEFLEILTFPLHHRILCQGYLFREKQSAVRVDKTKIHALHLSNEQIIEVMRGQSIIVHGQSVTQQDLLLEPASRLSYAYCSDTAYAPYLTEWLHGVDVLYHEATFRNELFELAKETGHSTAGQAGSIAMEAAAGCLILGHYSSRYKSLSDLLDEAKMQFPNTILSEEGKRYRLRDLAEGKFV